MAGIRSYEVTHPETSRDIAEQVGAIIGRKATERTVHLSIREKDADIPAANGPAELDVTVLHTYLRDDRTVVVGEVGDQTINMTLGEDADRATLTMVTPE